MALASYWLEGPKRLRTPSWACSCLFYLLHRRLSNASTLLLSSQAPSVPRTGGNQVCRRLTPQAQQSHGNMPLLSLCTHRPTLARGCGPAWISSSKYLLRCHRHLPTATRLDPRHQAHLSTTASQSPRHRLPRNVHTHRHHSHQSRSHPRNTPRRLPQLPSLKLFNSHPHLCSSNAVQVPGLASVASAGTATITLRLCLTLCEWLSVIPSELERLWRLALAY